MAYLGVDIGGTKTLLAVLSDDGLIQEKIKHPTDQDYQQWLADFAKSLEVLKTRKFKAVGVGLPGRIDRVNGIGVASPHLAWRNVHIKDDIASFTNAPTDIENDAKLAALSEAKLLKSEYNRILYITLSTGIGGGFIINGVIDPNFADTEPGQILVEYDNHLEKWEDTVSGSSIVKRYGKQAHEITDEKTWHDIAHYIALGFIDLIAVLQPEVIVVGGSVGAYFNQFEKPLMDMLKQYENPLTPIPPIIEAKRPDEAVVFGCYDLVSAKFGSVRQPT